MCPPRLSLTLVALLGLPILVPVGLVGCATPGEDAPQEPDAAVEVQDEQNRYGELEAENAELNRELADLKRKNEDLRRENDHLLMFARQRGFTGDIAKPAQPRIKATVHDVNRESATQVKGQSDRCAALEAKNADLKRQVADLERQHEELKREKAHLENRIPLSSAPFPGGHLFPAIEAVVWDVNRKQKFVLLSVGAQDDVSKGFGFIISRKGRYYIGKVQVDQVYQESCTASFLELAPGLMIEVGDTASTRP